MLQEQLETLAKQHSSLERAATLSDTHSSNPPLSAYSDMEEEFHDAAEELSLSGSRRHHGSCRNSDSESLSTLNDVPPSAASTTMALAPSSFVPIRHPPVANRSRAGFERRSKIPDRPDLPINLWSIMKNCIGKELSKIPMPVNFSEPLSVLQRITEDLEYASLLETASTLEPIEQMAYVAAYAVSNYSTTGIVPINHLIHS
ncbi:hypothetical protein KIN20_031820 [Parelaphostrongylus tenuis]|uniref:Oxysterol-binding protein n=1 Tax=Parelaphostrongylus tenuis TaxID=148309 RepID=A0AAD5R601_PARTN|nr:hypothetical protein KIN20_031820 [Parelaphostrongylus tenuis]